jgi:hypothetical protein
MLGVVKVVEVVGPVGLHHKEGVQCEEVHYETQWAKGNDGRSQRKQPAPHLKEKNQDISSATQPPQIAHKNRFLQ